MIAAQETCDSHAADKRNITADVEYEDGARSLSSGKEGLFQLVESEMLLAEACT